MSTVNTVGDFVWIDSNRNGIQDGGEPGAAGVTVSLRTGSRTLAVTTTNDVGHYGFDKVLPGSYAVTFSNLPRGYTFTSQFAPGATSDDNSNANPSGLTPIFRISLGSSDLTIDAGLVPVPSFAVGNHVWIDTNGNGIEDGSEPPVPGCTVTLFAADGVTSSVTGAIDIFGNPVSPMVTNAAGYYAFDDLPAGSYIAHFTNPLGAGYQFTAPGGASPVFTIGTAQPNTTAVTALDTATNGGSLDATMVDRTIDAGLEPLPGH